MEHQLNSKAYPGSNELKIREDATEICISIKADKVRVCIEQTLLLNDASFPEAQTQTTSFELCNQAPEDMEETGTPYQDFTDFIAQPFFADMLAYLSAYRASKH